MTEKGLLVENERSNPAVVPEIKPLLSWRKATAPILPLTSFEEKSFSSTQERAETASNAKMRRDFILFGIKLLRIFKNRLIKTNMSIRF